MSVKVDGNKCQVIYSRARRRIDALGGGGEEGGGGESAVNKYLGARARSTRRRLELALADFLQGN